MLPLVTNLALWIYEATQMILLNIILGLSIVNIIYCILFFFVKAVQFSRMCLQFAVHIMAEESLGACWRKSIMHATEGCMGNSLHQHTTN